MLEYTVPLPLLIRTGTTKRGKDNILYLNLNQYRNTHFYTLNKAKVIFKEEVSKAISELPKFKTIELSYVLYPRTKRECDVSNICSIVDKFFSDALVELGKLEDDSYKFIRKISYEFGDIDPMNPRVDVSIKETSPMRIIFDKQEILAALKQYAKSVITLDEREYADIRLEATNEGAFIATMNVSPRAHPASSGSLSASRQAAQDALKAAGQKITREGDKHRVKLGKREVVINENGDIETLEDASEQVAERPAVMTPNDPAESVSETPYNEAESAVEEDRPGIEEDSEEGVDEAETGFAGAPEPVAEAGAEADMAEENQAAEQAQSQPQTSPNVVETPLGDSQRDPGDEDTNTYTTKPVPNAPGTTGTTFQTTGEKVPNQEAASQVARESLLGTKPVTIQRPIEPPAAKPTLEIGLKPKVAQPQAAQPQATQPQTAQPGIGGTPPEPAPAQEAPKSIFSFKKPT